MRALITWLEAMALCTSIASSRERTIPRTTATILLIIKVAKLSGSRSKTSDSCPGRHPPIARLIEASEKVSPHGPVLCAPGGHRAGRPLLATLHFKEQDEADWR